MQTTKMFPVLLLAIGLFAFRAYAQSAPTLINYQGRLTIAEGNVFSKSRTITFKITKDL